MPLADPDAASFEALGVSEAFVAFQQRVSEAAKVNRPVLLVGERGSGKELAARRLHYLSARWEGPLVALNCAALAESLLESELFGHEAGAFTGAAGRRPGRFEAAQEGTLFLDEIGLLPMVVQEKILRAVEYGSFERVGSSRPIAVDTRIVGATNADLPAQARRGAFKQDLLDRLSFEVLYLPPLRERQEDIPLLARRFAAGMAREIGLDEPPAFSEAATRSLLAHPWPGNVRELKNVVERAVYRSGGRTIRSIPFDPFRNPYAPPAPDAASTPPEAAGPYGAGGRRPSLREEVRALEERRLDEALEAARGRQAEAARLLGLTYHQFRALYRKRRRPARP